MRHLIKDRGDDGDDADEGGHTDEADDELVGRIHLLFSFGFGLL